MTADFFLSDSFGSNLGVRCGEGESKNMAIHTNGQTSPSMCGYRSRSLFRCR